jgi:tetratricopeptide (TPR) repeat protein
VINPDAQSKKRQPLKERFKRLNKSEDSARLLNLWLTESELNVELAHIFQSLEDNHQNIEQLPVCSAVIEKFTNKACQTNRAIQLLQAIERLLEDYQELDEFVTAKLYISKSHCLRTFNTLDSEAEDCLYRAVTLSKNDTEKIKAYLLLASYYEDVSEYNKMKDVLLKCEAFCINNPIHEDLLACTWVSWGKYYFYRFKLSTSEKYFKLAKIKLELPCKQQTHKEILRVLSECLHYMSRIYFEEHDFINSASSLLESQNVLEESCQENKLTPDVGATAFYHLRLGHLLEASQIQYSAKYHFDKCRRLFNERGNGSSTLVHVNLALANLIKSESHDIKQNFQKEEEQIKDSAKQSLVKGYSRGYLMALVQLLSLYTSHRKIYLLIKVVVAIIFSKEFRNLGGIFFLKNYIYYKFFRKYKSRHILSVCPCSEPKCKIATPKQVETVRQAIVSGE